MQENNNWNQMNQNKRLFVAIDLPLDVLMYLGQIQAQLKDEALFEGSYPQLEHMHLTLVFIGEVPVTEVVKIEAALDSIRGASLRAQLSKLSVFKRRGYIKIIFADVMCPGLDELVNSLQHAIDRWIIKEEHGFVSHATLARVKHVNDEQQLEEFVEQYEIDPLIFTVDSFALKESELTPEGPIHRDIERYELSGHLQEDVFPK